MKLETFRMEALMHQACYSKRKQAILRVEFLISKQICLAGILANGGASCWRHLGTRIGLRIVHIANYMFLEAFNFVNVHTHPSNDGDCKHT